MPFPKLLHLLTALAFLLLHQFCFGQLKQAPQFFLYEDSSKKLTAQSALQIYQQGKFTKQIEQEVNLGFTRSVFWLAYKSEQQPAANSLMLYIGHHHINIIDFFFYNGYSLQKQYTTGDYFLFTQRPVAATGFYFPVNNKGVYLARIDKSNESLQLSFGILSQVDALTNEAENKSVVALFTGMILLLVIFGVFLFVITGERIYFFYISYIASGWLWVLANAGYGFQYLWPNLPWFASKARPVFALLPLVFSTLFLSHYIGGIQNKKLLRFIFAMNGLLVSAVVFILLLNDRGYQSRWWYYIQFLIPLLALLYVFVIIVILGRASVRGNKLAIFYLIAIIVLLVSALLQASFSFGKLGSFSKFFSHYGLAVGYVVEAIILTAGLVFRFNQYRLDKERLLLEMNAQEVDNTRILMEVQEAERSQVANQLHDVAGSLLSAAKLNISSIREKQMLKDEQTNFLLVQTEEAVRLVGDVVRNLSHSLSPVMLEKVGLKTSLEKVIAIVNASGKIQISLLVTGFENYTPAFSKYYTALYGMVYELLNNMVKHSGAKHALVQVTEHEDWFILIAEDDGVGMNEVDLKEKQMMGMAGLHSKINYFGGSIAFDKNHPTGLIVTIEIPIIRDAK